MKVIRKGPEPYEIGVVYCTHGDEVAGKKAVEKLLQNYSSFQKGVKFVFANEKAYQQEKRYIDTDLNRSFPGNKNSDKYEERIAAEIMEELKDTEIVLDLHETSVKPAPFALYTWNTDKVFDALQKTGVEKAVEISYTPGCGINYYGGIEVETGPKGTKKSRETAYKTLKQYLKNYKVIDGEKNMGKPEIYTVYSKMDRPEGRWEIKAENFQKVQEDEVIAEKPENRIKAEEPFQPVLFDESYSDIIGFKAVRLQKLERRLFK